MDNKLKTLLTECESQHMISKQTRKPVDIAVSLNDIKRYIAQETNDYLVYQWCQAYINRYNQID